MQITYQDAVGALASAGARKTLAATSEPVVLSPAVQMAALARHNNLRWYEGTVPHATKVANRRRNKAARRARRVHRR